MRARMGSLPNLGSPGRHHASNHAAVRLFQFVKAREGRTEAHLLGIPGINTRHQGFHDPFESMPPESPPEKCGERFVLARPARRDCHITSHTCEIEPRQESAAEKWPELSGCEGHQSFGQF